jgi:hypothetical protein
MTALKSASVTPGPSLSPLITDHAVSFISLHPVAGRSSAKAIFKAGAVSAGTRPGLCE